MWNLQRIITLVLIVLATIALAVKTNILEFAKLEGNLDQKQVTSCQIANYETSRPSPANRAKCSGARLEIVSDRHQEDRVATNFLELVHQNAAATTMRSDHDSRLKKSASEEGKQNPLHSDSEKKPKKLNFYVFGEFSFEDSPGTYALGFGQGSYKATYRTNNWWFGGPSCNCKTPYSKSTGYRGRCYCFSTDRKHNISLEAFAGTNKLVLEYLS